MRDYLGNGPEIGNLVKIKFLVSMRWLWVEIRPWRSDLRVWKCRMSRPTWKFRTVNTRMNFCCWRSSPECPRVRCRGGRGHPLPATDSPRSCSSGDTGASRLGTGSCRFSAAFPRSCRAGSRSTRPGGRGGRPRLPGRFPAETWKSPKSALKPQLRWGECKGRKW